MLQNQHQIDGSQQQHREEENAPMANLGDLPLEMIVKIMSELPYKTCLNLRQTNMFIDKLFKKYRSSMKGPTINCKIIYENGYVKFSVLNIESDTYELIPENRWKFIILNGHINKCTIETDDFLTESVVENIFCALTIKDISYKGPEINQYWADVVFSNAHGERKLMVEKWDASIKYNGHFTLLKISEPIENLIQIMPNVPNFEVFTPTRSCREAANLLINLQADSIAITKWVFIFSELEAEDVGQYPDMTVLIDEISRISSNNLMASIDFDRITFEVVE